MKKLLFILSITIALISCQTEIKNPKPAGIQKHLIEPISDKVLESAVIYEANIRQYSPEGTFNEFTKDIPKLKDLGVKILWLMPIYPISTTKSKGTLGSYYAVSDYTKVNPEFGNLEDFRKLLQTAHDQGIYVILDWVPNHTGWDHIWIKEHPEFYTKNDKGEITDPLNEDGSPVGWSDVADLNYNNQDMRNAMISSMKYWLTEENIDGFRCDVAGSVPIDFWEEAIPQLRKEKEIFMLAEAWEPELMYDDLFDMVYGWDTHHVMNAIAKGEKNVKAWDERMTQIDSMYQKDDILMNFTSNHDENSWNGTVFERMGEAAEVFTTLTYVTPGMPLIYSGQEYDMNKRLRFFEKDTIVKTKGKFFSLYKKLGALKNNNSAINGGKNAAKYKRINTTNDINILAFTREKEDKEILFIANLNEKNSEFIFPISGYYQDYFTRESFTLSETENLIFEPWQYKILIKE
jgi:alpha-amylase